MTAIWQNQGDSWKLLTPVGFPAEAALHDLVAQSPEMLPLSGSPRVVVLGREVQLGTGYADILAIEDNGRLVVIEVKLAKNSEARRAVVAQVLAYAAYLHGMQVSALENLLSQSLVGGSIRDSVAAALNDLRDWDGVEAGLAASLAEGWFRLVLVLDQAPDDLVRLVGYLEQITNEQIIIDLVTVASYAVNGARVVVPQRFDSRGRESAPGERMREKAGAVTRQPSTPIVQGTMAFEEFLSEVSAEYRSRLATLTDWARQIEAKGHALLRTTIGNGRRVLRIQVPGEDACIVAIWAEKRRPGMSFHTTVAARRAPNAAANLQTMLPDAVDPYLALDDVGDALLAAVGAAYEEASSGRVTIRTGQAEAPNHGSQGFS